MKDEKKVKPTEEEGVQLTDEELSSVAAGAAQNGHEFVSLTNEVVR